MCGVAGFVTRGQNISDYKNVIEKMTNSLEKRGPDDKGYALYKNAALGHRRLVVVDPEGGAQPMIKQQGDRTYTIVYNGELYNTEEVRTLLIEKGYAFNSYSDTEVLLTAYIEWKEECLKYINGIYAFGIWEDKYKTLFLARDPLGVKPLYYFYSEDTIVFASEIKAILLYPKVKPILDEEGFLEIFGLGPARTLGCGIFKGIREVPPSSYLYFNRDNMRLEKYWDLVAKEHKENFEDTVEHTRSLLIDAIERQLISDVPVCTFLSGGLDSSAISSIASNYFKNNNKGKLNTFSINYEDNLKYFKSSKFQPSDDTKYARIMADYLDSNHTEVILNNEDLANALLEAVLANDLPGMADIDSSLLLFCKEVRKKATVALSGECADEIFGGYPWFREENLDVDTFPWAKSLELRKSIINDEYKNLNLEEYVREKYQNTVNATPRLDDESVKDNKLRELFYLNIKWFMMTLLNRKDRMSMTNSLEVRVPFADYRLVEYAYNIPNSMKFYKGREKGLLREALKGILPDEILWRKKSPYPKTYNPIYEKLIRNNLIDILKNGNAPLNSLIDSKKVLNMVNDKKDIFNNPWYGQLMKKPQVMAYLIQINMWLNKYKVDIKI
ncbi:MAG: asparagine synthase (glutamine-hydrolyzing) [Clostridiaceae bacterium]